MFDKRIGLWKKKFWNGSARRCAGECRSQLLIVLWVFLAFFIGAWGQVVASEIGDRPFVASLEPIAKIRSVFLSRNIFVSYPTGEGGLFVLGGVSDFFDKKMSVPVPDIAFGGYKGMDGGNLGAIEGMVTVISLTSPNVTKPLQTDGWRIPRICKNEINSLCIILGFHFDNLKAQPSGSNKGHSGLLERIKRFPGSICLAPTEISGDRSDCHGYNESENSPPFARFSAGICGALILLIGFKLIGYGVHRGKYSFVALAFPFHFVSIFLLFYACLPWWPLPW